MITTFASGTQTATVTTEHVLSAPAVQGTFQGVVDLVNMAAGDVVELRVYQMAIAGGTSRVAVLMTFYGVQSPDDLIALSPLIRNALTDANAVQFTLKQTFGTSRNFAWAVEKDDALTPTVTATTLDVAATGEAGLDFANIKDATGAHTLTNITVPVTTGVTNDVGVTQAAADKVFGASGAALAELPQAAPTATPSPRAAVMLLYMALRNLVQVTATEKRITDDTGTVITKKTISDDGTTYAETEMVSGP